MSNEKKFYTGKFDFIGKAKAIISVWSVITIIGLFVIAYKGFQYGIDFKGGTEIQIQFQKPVDIESLRKVISEQGYEKAVVQTFGQDNEYLIRVESLVGKDDRETNEMQNAMVAKITNALKTSFADSAVEVRRVDSVGPQVGDELKRSSVLATFYSLLMILVYIGMRFDYKYAPGAVICLLHDTLVTLAIFSLFGREVNVQTLAAVLTLLGYSLNDTIIVFDRIRENEKVFAGESFYGIVNRSINDMLGRTVLTVFTTLLACASLYFLSDGVIQQIAFTLGIGIILGTFSSIYVAAPLVIAVDHLEQKRSQTRMRAAKA